MSAPDSAIAALLESLHSPDAAVRGRTADALGRVGHNDAARAGPALLELLKDADGMVRSEAADALGILRYTPAASALGFALRHDPDALVRASAAESLGDLGDASAQADLLAALDDRDDAVRGYAANSIGLLGDASLAPELDRRAQQERSPAVKAEIYGACYRLGAGDCGRLIELLEAAGDAAAGNILNVIDDLAARRSPPGLASDSAQIQGAVKAVARRMQILEGDANRILARLEKLGPSDPDVPVISRP